MRYERQIAISSIGILGQERLNNSRVLVIGAGGLGSPVLYYLTAAGIGKIGIADFDTISESNLNRQILYTEADVGAGKAEIAKAKLSALNTSTRIFTHDKRINQRNIENEISPYDLIIDCVDNNGTRLHVSQACFALKKPLIEAGIDGFTGFVMSIIPGSSCFSCLNSVKRISQKANTPVLGATAGVAGSIQAAECVKLLLNIGYPLINKVLFFDLLNQEFSTIALNRNPSCPVCGG